MSSELFKAIERHQTGRVAELLSQGADPNAIEADGRGWTPLHSAIEELENGGSLEVLTLSLKHGANVNGWDASHQWTPLLMAMLRKNKEAARILLDVGADAGVRGDEGDSPLILCVEDQDCELAAQLLRSGAKKTINEWGPYGGLSALALAASQFNIPMIELLLDAGADPAALEDDHKTPRDHLPPREEHDPQAWDRVMEMLGRRKS
jgi:ankyrin repeat protein